MNLAAASALADDLLTKLSNAVPGSVGVKTGQPHPITGITKTDAQKLILNYLVQAHDAGVADTTNINVSNAPAPSVPVH